MAATDGDPRTFRDFLAEIARRHGSRPALRARVGGAQKGLAYVELRHAVDGFAAGLLRLGVQHGDKVALIAENGIEWAVAWLGVAAAGATNVPIYGELAPHEINNVLRQSDSRFAIVSATFLAKLDARPLERVVVLPGPSGAEPSADVIARLGAKAVAFGDVGAGLTATDRQRLGEVDLRPGDLAAIIYTSGTTGDPKGVMLSHRNFISDAVGAVHIVDAGPSDRLLLVLPLHHAFPFTAGLIGPLYAGAEVVFESDLRRIRERMAEIQPTIFFGVPALYATMYRSIVARMEAEGKLATFQKAERLSAQIKRRTKVNLGSVIFRELHQKLGARLRFLAVGGAAMPPDLTRRYAVLGLPIMQGWGLTEAGPIVAGQSPSTARFLFTDYYERVAGSVGLPAPGVEFAAVDVPDKSIYVQLHGEGELLVRGANVMAGYYKNETATREALIGDWLRTGDVGRRDRAGHIYLTGRAKSVIVLDSGEKVYPDEIEERFDETMLSRDVCIIGRRQGRLLGERKLLVCAVVHPDPAALRERARESRERLTAELVRRWVQQEVDGVQSGLAPYKRIGEVILTDSPLPRTDLKKVRRGQVREHYSFDLDRLLSAEPEAEI